MDKKAMYRLSYGLFVLTAKDGGRDNGCVVNTVTQVTSEPNRITVAINKNNLTHDMVLHSGEFNVSVLSQKASFEVYRHWGFQSGRDTDKMERVSANRSGNGLVYLAAAEANAFLSARVIGHKDLGSHTLFLADVTDGAVLSGEESVTYSYYQKYVKPAPSAAKKGFVCTVCGYIYEGESLPDDFICPVCKHPASDFAPLETVEKQEKQRSHAE